MPREHIENQYRGHAAEIVVEVGLEAWIPDTIPQLDPGCWHAIGKPQSRDDFEMQATTAISLLPLANGIARPRKRFVPWQFRTRLSEPAPARSEGGPEGTGSET